MDFSVADVLRWTGGRLANESALAGSQESIRISRPAALKGSRADEIAFFFSPSYKGELPFAAPGILITGEPFIKPLETAGLPLWKKSAVIACSDPYLALALISEKIAPSLSTVTHLPGSQSTESGEVHSSAIIARDASVGPGVRIGAHSVIESGARIGARTVIYPGCFVGPGAVIGEDCVLFPRVTVYESVQIGNRVRLHAGVVLGADGFGYAPVRQGDQVTGHQKIHHVGRVVIEDDVEIGANSCVDRATFGETRISRNAKIDNLVQLGHNTRLEEGAVMCGCSAIAGSGSAGKYSYIGGGAGVANQVHVGDRANVAAYTLVTKDVEPGGTVIGNPMREPREYFRIHALMTKLLTERKKKSNE